MGIPVFTHGVGHRRVSAGSGTAGARPAGEDLELGVKFSVGGEGDCPVLLLARRSTGVLGERKGEWQSVINKIGLGEGNKKRGTISRRNKKGVSSSCSGSGEWYRSD